MLRHKSLRIACPQNRSGLPLATSCKSKHTVHTHFLYEKLPDVKTNHPLPLSTMQSQSNKY